MHRLVVPSFILVLALALGCAREQAEEAGEVTPDTANADTMGRATADSVSQWVRQGETKAVRTPSGRACVFVRDLALVGLGDSVRFTIKRMSPADTLLPLVPDLPPGFRAATGRNWTVFPPIYDFSAHNAANEEIVQFPDTLIFAICSVATPSQAEALQRAVLARDPQDPENSLQLLALKKPPDQCELSPSCWSSPPEQGAVSLGRWLTGSPLVATPAHAAQLTIRGIGGGGTSNSPIAAVDSLPGGPSQTAP